VISFWRQDERESPHDFRVSEITITLLPEGDADGFARAYAIYHHAIELSEQRTEAEFRKLLLRPDYRFLVARRDRAIVGLSLAYVPSEDYFWLFEYAAVAPEARGQGIGAQLFLASRAMAGLNRIALVEVDADRGEEDQARRLRFYRGLGCRRLAGLDYLLPLDAFGEPPPMWLLARADAPALGVDLIERWLRSIYQDVYAKRLDDSRLAKMIDPLPDEVRLEAI
jgi:ribosomal protein S18 acetylase RimI-like enzyme